MAVAQLVAGQGCCQQHQRIGVRVQLTEKGYKGPVQCPQPAALDPALQQQQQVVNASQRRQFSETVGIQRGRQQFCKRAAHAGSPGKRSSSGSAWP